jgi:hypothetical protein
METRKRKTSPVWEVGTSGREENIRKGCKRVNMIEMLYTYVYKGKSEIC